MKIAFITAMWRRPGIFELFGKGIQNLQKHFPDVEIQCFVAGSEGEVSKSLAEKFGFVYTEFSNEHLNKKFNAACLSSKEWGPDRIIIMGSDNIMSADCFQMYLRLHVYDLISIASCHFIDTVTGAAFFWSGYSDPERHIAVGKSYGRKLLERMDYTICFDGHLYMTLEYGMELMLKNIECTKAVLHGQLVFDIKSPVNMNAFKLWDNCTATNAREVLTAGLGEEFANEILNFKE